MPVVTKIIEQKRRPQRRSVYLDGVFAFGCNVNVIAKFMLREGLELSQDMIVQILAGSVRQECFDKAIRMIERRLHSRMELSWKLSKFEYGQMTIDLVLDDMKRLGYVDDLNFAKSKASSAARHKHHGKNRAMIELGRAGVDREVARSAVEDVYDTHDSLSVARTLAQKKAKSLARFDDLTARRRLAGMLLRRGFEYETVRPVIDEVLGSREQEMGSD